MNMKNNKKRLLSRLRPLLPKLLNDERGQSTTEYILILSVVVMVALKFKGAFQKQLTGIVEKLGGNISNAVSDLE